MRWEPLVKETDVLRVLPVRISDVNSSLSKMLTINKYWKQRQFASLPRLDFGKKAKCDLYRKVDHFGH